MFTPLVPSAPEVVPSCQGAKGWDARDWEESGQQCARTAAEVQRLQQWLAGQEQRIVKAVSDAIRDTMSGRRGTSAAEEPPLGGCAEVRVCTEDDHVSGSLPPEAAMCRPPRPMGACAPPAVVPGPTAETHALEDDPQPELPGTPIQPQLSDMKVTPGPIVKTNILKDGASFPGAPRSPQKAHTTMAVPIPERPQASRSSLKANTAAILRNEGIMPGVLAPSLKLEDNRSDCSSQPEQQQPISVRNSSKAKTAMGIRGDSRCFGSGSAQESQLHPDQLVRRDLDKIMRKLDALVQEAPFRQVIPNTLCGSLPIVRGGARSQTTTSATPLFKKAATKLLYPNAGAADDEEDADAQSTLAASTCDSKKNLGQKAELKPWPRRLDYASILIIFLNTVWLGCEAELTLHAAAHGTQPPHWARTVTMGFAGLYAAELGFKVAILRADFWRRDFGWNIFDSCLLLSTILSVFIELLAVGFTRTLRILRAIRAARCLRILGYMPQLRQIIAALTTTMPAVCWVTVLLIVLLILTSIEFMLGIEGYIRENGADDMALRRFGSFEATMSTLFMSISGGIDWEECLDTLQKASNVYKMLFVLWVGIISFAVISVLTAIIIDASSRILHVDKDLVVQQQIKEDKAKAGYLEQLFREMDHGAMGFVTQGQLDKALEEEETLALLKTLDLDVTNTRFIFGFLEKTTPGLVGIEEFVKGLMNCRGNAVIMQLIFQELTKIGEEVLGSAMEAVVSRRRTDSEGSGDALLD